MSDHLEMIENKLKTNIPQQEIIKVKKQRHSKGMIGYYDPVKQQWIWRD